MRILHHGRDQLLDPTAYKGVATMPPEAGSASCLGQYQSSQMELIEAEPGSRAEPDALEPCRRTRAVKGWPGNDSLGCTTWRRPPLTTLRAAAMRARGSGRKDGSARGQTKG